MKTQEKKLTTSLKRMRATYKRTGLAEDKSKVNNLRWRLWELRRAA